MPRLNVPLTRSTLLETERALTFAREGHDLLDRKREVLVNEILGMVSEADATQGKLTEEFAQAYAALARARLTMGIEEVRRAALATTNSVDAHVTERSVMGAIAPTVDLTQVHSRPRYSPVATTAQLDRAVEAFAAAVRAVAKAAEMETSVWRLAAEIKKTQRRVNALRNIVIPNYERIVKMVQEALEEGEREAFYRAKMFKRNLRGGR